MRSIIAITVADNTFFVSDLKASKFGARRSNAKKFNTKTAEKFAAIVREWSAVKEMDAVVSILPSEVIKDVAEAPKAKCAPKAKRKYTKHVKVEVSSDAPKLDGRLMRGLPKALAKLGFVELQGICTKLNKLLSAKVAAAHVEAAAAAEV